MYVIYHVLQCECLHSNTRSLPSNLLLCEFYTQIHARYLVTCYCESVYTQIHARYLVTCYCVSVYTQIHARYLVTCHVITLLSSHCCLFTCLFSNLSLCLTLSLLSENWKYLNKHVIKAKL